MVIFWNIDNTNLEISDWDNLKIYDWSWSLLKVVTLTSDISYWTNNAFDINNKISLGSFIWTLKFELITNSKTFSDLTVEQDSWYNCENNPEYQSNKICKYNIIINDEGVYNSDNTTILDIYSWTNNLIWPDTLQSPLNITNKDIKIVFDSHFISWTYYWYQEISKINLYYNNLDSSDILVWYGLSFIESNGSFQEDFWSGEKFEWWYQSWPGGFFSFLQRIEAFNHPYIWDLLPKNKEINIKIWIVGYDWIEYKSDNYKIKINIPAPVVSSWGWWGSSWGWDSSWSDWDKDFSSWTWIIDSSVIIETKYEWYLKPKIEFKTTKYKNINTKLHTALWKISVKINEFSKYSKQQYETNKRFTIITESLTKILKALENAKEENDRIQITQLVWDLRNEVEQLKNIIVESAEIIKFDSRVIQWKNIKLIQSKNKITNKVMSRIDKIIDIKIKSKNIDLLIKHRNELTLIIDNLLSSKDNDEVKLYRVYLLEVFEQFKKIN